MQTTSTDAWRAGEPWSALVRAVGKMVLTVGHSATVREP